MFTHASVTDLNTSICKQTSIFNLLKRFLKNVSVCRFVHEYRAHGGLKRVLKRVLDPSGLALEQL